MKNEQDKFEKWFWRLFKAIGTLIVLVFLSIVVFGALRCSSNVSGANSDKARAEATAFVRDTLVMKDGRVSCQGADADGDGYVSCTAVDGERVVSLECAAAYTFNSGCKLAMPGLGNAVRNGR